MEAIVFWYPNHGSDIPLLPPYSIDESESINEAHIEEEGLHEDMTTRRYHSRGFLLRLPTSGDQRNGEQKEKTQKFWLCPICLKTSDYKTKEI